MPNIDYRARLQPKSFVGAEQVLGPNVDTNILYPLWSTYGVLFPYTPTVSFGYSASYDQTVYTHSNYGYNAYQKSSPKQITLVADFTAQSNDEAMYMLSVIHFLKSITKMYFGVQTYSRSGTPPPTLLFSYLGEHQFNKVPVIISDVSMNYDNTVSYVPVQTENKQAYSPNIGVNLHRYQSSGFTYVPSRLTTTIVLDTQYVPIKVRNEFNLDEFRQGKLMNGGYI